MSRALQIAALTGVVIAIWILYLYRKKRLREDHAILWLFVSISIAVISTWTDLLVAMRTLAGAANPTDLVLAVFVAFLLLTSIYYSVRISELAKQNQRLVQEIALLKVMQEIVSKEKADHA